jgi:hypothetical protein
VATDLILEQDVSANADSRSGAVLGNQACFTTCPDSQQPWSMHEEKLSVPAETMPETTGWVSPIRRICMLKSYEQ